MHPSPVPACVVVGGGWVFCLWVPAHVAPGWGCVGVDVDAFVAHTVCGVFVVLVEGLWDKPSAY